MPMQQYGNKITVSLKVGSGTGELPAATWRTRARTGDHFVQRAVTDADVPTANNSLISVSPLTDGGTDILGLLIAVDGDDSDLVGTVLLQASDVTVRGVGVATANLEGVNIDNRSGVVGSGNDGLVAVAADANTAGFGQVLGGNERAIRMAFTSNILRGVDHTS